MKNVVVNYKGVDDNGHEVMRWVGNFEPNVELKAFIKNG